MPIDSIVSVIQASTGGSQTSDTLPEIFGPNYAVLPEVLTQADLSIFIINFYVSQLTCIHEIQ